MTSRAAPAPPGLLANALRFVRERYMTVDLRTLAAFRIGFGLFLLGNLLWRMWGDNAVDFFTDEGVLPSHDVLKAPIDRWMWSLLLYVPTLGALRIALVAIVAVYVAYTVGWHTRLMQLLVVPILVSLMNRTPIIFNGGFMVMNIAAVFSAFLPLGDRYSIDALRHPDPEKEGTVTRLAYGWLIVNFGAIYFLNAVQKNGANWKDGSAFHCTMWLNGIATPLAGWIRMHEPVWFSPFMTYTTVISEYLIAALILSPIGQTLARKSAVWMILGLHIGIALLMELGPFSYVMITFSLLLLQTEHWDALEETVRERWGERLAPIQEWLAKKIPPDPSPRRSLLDGFPPETLASLRDAATGFLVVCCVAQMLVQNPFFPKPIRIQKRPNWVAAPIEWLRIRQWWHMFAPNVYTTENTFVVDGELPDHTHIDPLTGRPPDFDAPFREPWDYGEQWYDLFRRLAMKDFRAYLPSFRDYIMRIHTLPHAKIHEPLLRADIYLVSYKVPRMGSTVPTNVTKTLFISSAPGATPAPTPTPEARPAAPPPSATSQQEESPQ